jgi:hypothetical protein
MNRIGISVLILAALLPLSCKDCGTDGGTYNGGDKINPNILLVKSCCDDPLIGGQYRMGTWRENVIYIGSPFRRITLNSVLGVEGDTLIYLFGRHRFISNFKDRRIMMVRSNYADVSSGQLVEFNDETLTLRLLRDSTYNISSAIYLPKENRCVYYAYGNSTRQVVAGYYALDLATLQDSLLFQYVSEIGPSEVVNGFDISPNGDKLLFPVNRRTERPLIVEHLFASGVRETLNVVLERQLLWLRYHPSGNQILYSNYPVGAGGHTVADDGEIGVIDHSTLSKRILDVNTNPGGLSVNVFPNWSPDGKHIVYGSAKGPVSEPPGALSFYSLYILRDVN